MRTRANKPASWPERKARLVLEMSLTAPARDHAGQIAALRTAIANTAVASPPLGLLLWPAGFPLDDVLAVLDVSHRRFKVVVDGAVPTWRHLYAATSATLVFDPCGISGDDSDCGAQVRRKRFERVLVGIEDCHKEVMRLAAGVPA